MSILILTHNAPKYVKLTLDSLWRYTSKSDINFEVIVLDNQSKLPTRLLLRYLYLTKKIHKLSLSTYNTLFAGGNNMMSSMVDIVKFAELEEFMDQKLKNYSSGMQVRLAFSIAIKADADILVLDEVLAVGDEAFQRKCFNYFAELKRAKKTVILVTHSMEYIQQFCNRAALIDRGHRIIVGDPLMIANMYQKANSEDLDEIKDSEIRNNNDDITVKTMCDKTDDLISLDIEVTSKYTLEDAVVTAVFNRNNGEIACRWASDDTDHQSFDIIGGKSKKIRIEFDNIFPDGVYDIQISVKKQDRTKEYAVFDSINKFEITSVGPYWMPHFKEEVQR